MRRKPASLFPRSSILDPQSSILNPLSSILYPLSSIFGTYSLKSPNILLISRKLTVSSPKVKVP
jgi:hypothetical protein